MGVVVRMIIDWKDERKNNVKLLKKLIEQYVKVDENKWINKIKKEQ